jgi:hypothetical protein
LTVLCDTVLQHRYSEALAIFALLLQVGSLLLKRVWYRHYASAEEIRRIAVLKDGLGLEPSELHKAEIVSRVGNAPEVKRIFVGKYYASEKVPSVARFLDDVAESAFWTQKVAYFAGSAILAVVLVAAGISVFSLLGFVTAGLAPAKLKIMAEALVVTLGFIVTSELLFLSLEYFGLSENACRKLSAAFMQLELGPGDRDAALLLFGEYNCALASAPPLPNFIYKLLQQKLIVAWETRKMALPLQ